MKLNLIARGKLLRVANTCFSFSTNPALPSTSADVVALIAFGLDLLVHASIVWATMSNPVGVVVGLCAIVVDGAPSNQYYMRSKTGNVITIADNVMEESWWRGWKEIGLSCGDGGRQGCGLNPTIFRANPQDH